ncbi:hypothetical protein MKW92_014849 [Papaver armeniacum]|nr:hypothetical protein MKW92_014849 [Papaver armeniacum]
MSTTSVKSSVLLMLSFFYLAISIRASSSTHHGDFLKCLSGHSNTSIPVYTPQNSNYSFILQSTMASLKFNTSTTPKPFLILTPLKESHVQTAVICSKKHGIQIKVRSGGHDFEGLSYISDVPFIIVDLFNLKKINVDVNSKVAWVQSGATTGEVYYKIAKKSKTLGFPAAICTTVGVGGHFSGGGYGFMLRKYGTAADNVIDARIVDVHGNILNRKSMGKGFFWAIRGGGGGSFGIVISWKIKLVSVPPVVTVFSVSKTLAEGATSLVHKWQQVAHKLPHELFIMLGFGIVNSAPKGEKTIIATFNSMYLGDAKKLKTIMQARFPELGLENKDYTEMSWIQSVLLFDGIPTNSSIDVLVNRPQPKSLAKIKSDYVKQVIPLIELENIWERILKDEQNGMMFMPYGGKMSEIAETETPFPHRNGTLFKIIYLVYWTEEQVGISKKYLNQIKRMYEFMTPYVSKSPREAYANYRDLDLGQTSKNGTASYAQAKVWGSKYFKNNFDKLVYVKSKVDPDNFFRNEQSIPRASSLTHHGDFLKCLSDHSNNPIPIYTPQGSNYSLILESTMGNLRFNTSSTPKPFLILTPLKESHAQTTVICSRKHGIQIKVRSGGHDFEGLSYISDVPFIILDLFNLREIDVDVNGKVAWVQSGATTGEVYYKIAEKSNTLGFPAATCTTVGMGGQLSGGGYGFMLRKYGLAADNIIDARIVDVHGRILNRKSMGKGLFWAIRGGGGGNFGIVISWKIKLVSVPPVVTVFSVSKTLAEGATSLVHKWQQVAHKLPHDLFLQLGLSVVDATPEGEKTILAIFDSMYLGDAKKLQTIMQDKFPELGLEGKDYTEMSWIQSVLLFDGIPTNSSIDILVNRPQAKSMGKGKSDYVKQVISQIELERIWERMLKDEQNGMVLIPYGGKMSEIAESETPFPHRDGTLFMIFHFVFWDEKQAPEKYINQIKRTYEFMTPYVSKSPRGAYVNYRDLDLGQTSINGTASYAQAKIWGSKYFKGNFDKLVYVKSKVDPDNFFRNEQSIPSVAH